MTNHEILANRIQTLIVTCIVLALAGTAIWKVTETINMQFNQITQTLESI